ncbi:MAG: MFS transporter [Spirochaeta sp.]|jgi:OFA family oxalate/formate antiporter-like MFS transporter|nr:MFS transporter [Spirochaeta sp.]
MTQHTEHPGSPKVLRNFPINPGKLPFFYGWGVLVFGTLGMVMSVPGQTVGVSVFTDFLIEELALSRTIFSLAYLVGTVGSALALSQAGRLYDYFGGRLVGSVAALTLALVLVGLTVTPALTAMIGGSVAAFIIISIGFFLLRFSGQGMLTRASRNMVMEWFDERRGLANAVMGVSISFGFSYAPRVFDDIIQLQGWQGAWRLMAAAIFLFALLAFLFYRDTPEAHGLLPDGPLHGKSKNTHAESHEGRPFTLPEARRTYSFWVFALTLLVSGFVTTAYTFQIVSIFADAGMTRAQAVAVFLPTALVAVTFEFIGSFLSDYIKLKYLAMLQLTGQMVLTVSVSVLAPGFAVVGVIVGQGIMQGMFGILSNVTWPRFFGRAHLGAISGFATALTVAGTAVGPYAFSFGRDLTGAYATPALVACAVGAALFFAATKAERPR